MTRALVVYESMFGDVRTITYAIADGLGAAFSADVVDAADAPAELPGDVRLLVVGGSTTPSGCRGPPRGRVR